MTKESRAVVKEFAPVTGVNVIHHAEGSTRKRAKNGTRFRLPHASCDTETEGQELFREKKNGGGGGRRYDVLV